MPPNGEPFAYFVHPFWGTGVAASERCRDGGFVEASNSDGVGVHWQHGDKYIVHVKLMSAGPSAPNPTTKIDSMKQLAQKVEAALGS